MNPIKHDNLALERFREYMKLLAKLHLGPQNRAKVDASDIVQQALLTAHEKREQYRGESDAELAGWLRRILANSLTDALRSQARQKRDAGREKSLEYALDESASRLVGWLAADQSTPSIKAQHHEQILQLAEALARLPDDQREALLMRHCKGMSLNDIAVQLGRTERSIAGLLQRGLSQLRSCLHS